MAEEDVISAALRDAGSQEPPNPISAPPKRTVRSRHGPGRKKPPSASEAVSRPTPPKTPPKAAKTAATDYAEAVAGIGQLVAAPLIIGGQTANRPELIADGAAVLTHIPPIAAAINDLAQNDPRVAAMLDRLLIIGPYGALLAATFPLIAQIATNHKPDLLPMTQGVGAVDPQRLIDSFAPPATPTPEEAARNGAAHVSAG